MIRDSFFFILIFPHRKGVYSMSKRYLTVLAAVVFLCAPAQAVMFQGVMDNRAGLPYIPGFTAQSLAWIVGGSRGEGLRLEWQADNETTPGAWTYTYTLTRGSARNKGFAFFDIETAADFTGANLTAPPQVTATTSTGLPVSGITVLGPVNFNQTHDFGVAGSNETTIATVLDKADLSHYSGDPGRSAAGLPGGSASATPTAGPVEHPFFGLRVTFPGSFADLSYVASDWQIRIVCNRVPMWGDFFGWGDQTFIPPFWYSNVYNTMIDTPDRLTLAPASSLTGSDPYRGWILVPGSLPSVLTSNPANLATAVPPTEPVTVTFSGLMDPATVTPATFTLSSGTQTVPGAISYDAATRIATLTPGVPLAGGATYSATIVSGPAGVRDLAGNPLAQDINWSFTTTSADQTPPEITDRLPGDGATYVSANSSVSVLFNEAIDPATLGTATFTLSDGSGPLGGAVSYAPATRTATFTPAAPLSHNTLHTVALSAIIKDLAGNPLPQTSWSFTTIPGETVLPIVSATVPGSQAGNVSVFNPVSASFSEDMDQSTINSASFLVSGVSGSVSYDGVTRTARFTPDVPLTNSTTYTASITTAARDLAGNGIPLAKVWSFTTGPPDSIPPSVIGTQPSSSAVNVPLSSAVSAAFSEPINPGTIGPASFTLSGQSYAGSTPFSVSGATSYNSFTSTAQFSPTSPLAMGTVYTARLTSAITDLAGNALTTEKSWVFSTTPDAILVAGEQNASIADALLALRMAVGLVEATQFDKSHGDVAPLGPDGKPQPDGQITIQDALIILRKVVGLTTW